MANRLLEDLPNASRNVSAHKDWNEELKEHLELLQQQMHEQQRMQRQERGFRLSY